MKDPVSRGRVEELVQASYDRFWSRWYQGTGKTKARVEVVWMVADSAYSPRRDLIRLSLGDGNLDDHDVEDVDGWPVWKGELVHEMIHEYQAKIAPGPSSSAVELARKHGGSFCGPGHDAVFFAAAESFCAAFGHQIDELLQFL